MPKRPASVPDRCIYSRSSVPNEGVSSIFSSSRPSCIATLVASGIWPLVLIRTSVVMECEANLSLPSRQHPLCLLHFPSALATLCDSLNGGWDLFLVPWWVGEKDPVICSGESGDQLWFCFVLVIQALPINDHWLWDGYGCIPLIFGCMENSFYCP